MERESFENADIAAAAESRISCPIKVDREERPDVDRIYMLFVQASTGSGGWPMSVLLTPERKPFFGGTYFPPDNRYGRPGFGAILAEPGAGLAGGSRARGGIRRAGGRAVEGVSPRARGDRRSRPGKDALDAAFYAFRRDVRFAPGRLRRRAEVSAAERPSISCCAITRATGNEEALDMVLLTLREMAKGGMNDQLGGGFHRYSVDERWFVPHFEKMLYDQAQLAVSYLEAFQITRDGQYAAAARDIFSYVLRDLTHPDGGFYSAEDADSAADPAHPARKTRRRVLCVDAARKSRPRWAPGDAAIFCYRYGVEASGQRRGGSARRISAAATFCTRRIRIEETAAHSASSMDEARAILHNAAVKLLEVRGAAPAAASGRQDPDRLERADDFGVRQGRAGSWTSRAMRTRARGAVDFLRRKLWR